MVEPVSLQFLDHLYLLNLIDVWLVHIVVVGSRLNLNRHNIPHPASLYSPQSATRLLLNLRSLLLSRGLLWEILDEPGQSLTLQVPYFATVVVVALPESLLLCLPLR